MVTLSIDHKTVTVPKGTTILEAARQNGISIPTLCYLKEINEIGACRICCVEVEGMEQLVSACNSAVQEGMSVYTRSSKAIAARKINLQLILSQHHVQCTSCSRNGNCTLQRLAKEHNLTDELFEKQIKGKPVEPSTPIVRHDDRCIRCMRCVQVCEKMQGMGIWDLIGSGPRVNIGVRGVRNLKDSLCTFCGQCITHCPVGALEERDDTREVYRALNDREIITVVQVAPAVRAAWAEDYRMDPSQATPGRMVAALKELGFDYVFDTNFAADLTIMEEGSELLKRLSERERNTFPMFTSCCPGWVRYVKGKYPEFTAQLSSAKSPQQMFGAVAKSYFAQKIGVAPEKLHVISIMPCTAKKQEAVMEPMQFEGIRDVDSVLTTREMVRMLRTAQLDPISLPEKEFDNPLGTGTGAAVIFGTTGGVMDAALRSAYYLAVGRNPDPDAFKNVRGSEGRKEATFAIPGVGDLRVAVVNGLANAEKLLNALKKGEAQYDFVEIMACPGGCAGGGGQPIHDGEELAAVRGDRLWQLDSGSKVRFSHENPDVQMLYKEYLGTPLGEKAHHLLHTDHNAWSMP